MNKNKIALSIRNVSKSFDKTTVLHSISTDVFDKEMLVLLGPSGCGKTTLLKIIAGLLDHDKGEIFINNRNVTKDPPYRRDIGLVFQNYALFPHMNVFDNVAYGLKMRGIEKNEQKRRVTEILNLVRLGGMEKRPIKKMSGGQQQRVALARALVLNPSLLLMDEPLSNLDAKLRAIVRVEIAQIQKQLGLTAILVTHDQTEAMTMGDRIILMSDGMIRQEGTPQEIFDQPKDIFVASFIGSPQINLINAFSKDECVKPTYINGKSCSLAELSTICSSDIDLNEINGDVVLGVRPENFEITKNVHEALFNGEIVFIENLGSELFIHVISNGKEIISRCDPSDGLQLSTGMKVGLNCKTGYMHVFNAETTNRISKE